MTDQERREHNLAKEDDEITAALLATCAEEPSDENVSSLSMHLLLVQMGRAWRAAHPNRSRIDT